MILNQETSGWDWSSIQNAVSNIEWIDWTAIVILSVFFLLGLFRGFVWQASRILSLVLAYVVAGVYGESGASVVRSWFAEDKEGTSAIPLYLSYVAVFVLTLVVLSIIAYFVQKLIKKTGLSTYDRLGGGFLGFATGAFVMIAILAVIMMFVPDDFALKKTARESKAMAFSRKTLSTLGDLVPRPMRQVFAVGEEADDEAGQKPGAREEPGDGR